MFSVHQAVFFSCNLCADGAPTAQLAAHIMTYKEVSLYITMHIMWAVLLLCSF